MKKLLLLAVLLLPAMIITACGDEDQNSKEKSNQSDEDVKSQEAMSTMNDMVKRMEELDYTSIDFDVIYDDQEFEGEIEKDDNLVESEFYDPFNSVDERGADAFDAIYPIVKDLELKQDMTDEEAIATSLKAFSIPDNFLKAVLQVTFKDGTDKVYEIKMNEM
ncbi:YusW family protein [Virgibacillus litoralis]|uniref:ABC-type Fe3+-citrate transport system substrate-binding protein n=1 Tax=Virgibacillus litoralis TaxID=578221 RepID=A0ABS4HJ99_9BACI|nr:YusW family protein [Virgibacillus litoralis]MBP1950893.1 ABC-type Fe3+-citrate transport system substrate-binding protein [Virgibacillus litoralis]